MEAIDWKDQLTLAAATIRTNKLGEETEQKISGHFRRVVPQLSLDYLLDEMIDVGYHNIFKGLQEIFDQPDMHEINFQVDLVLSDIEKIARDHRYQKQTVMSAIPLFEEMFELLQGLESRLQDAKIREKDATESYLVASQRNDELSRHMQVRMLDALAAKMPEKIQAIISRYAKRFHVVSECLDARKQMRSFESQLLYYGRHVQKIKYQGRSMLKKTLNTAIDVFHMVRPTSLDTDVVGLWYAERVVGFFPCRQSKENYLQQICRVAFRKKKEDAWKLLNDADTIYQHLRSAMKATPDSLCTLQRYESMLIRIGYLRDGILNQGMLVQFSRSFDALNTVLEKLTSEGSDHISLHGVSHVTKHEHADMAALLLNNQRAHTPQTLPIVNGSNVHVHLYHQYNKFLRVVGELIKKGNIPAFDKASYVGNPYHPKGISYHPKGIF